MLTNEETWTAQAECRAAEPDLFYDHDGERGTMKRARRQEAKAWCAVCPVRRECFDFSLANREPYGVWGGVDEDERRTLLAKEARTRRRRA